MMVSEAELAGLVTQLTETGLMVELTRLDAGPIPVCAPVASAIAIRGAFDGLLALELSLELARLATATVLGKSAEDVTEDEVADVVGELTNILGGTVKALLPAPSKLHLPRIVGPEELARCEGDGMRVLARTAFAHAAEPMAVLVAQGSYEPTGQRCR